MTTKQADLYMVHLLTLMMLMPLAAICHIENSKRKTLLEVAKIEFNCANSRINFGSEIKKVCLEGNSRYQDYGYQLFDKINVDKICNDLADSIISSAMPTRQDILFYGDPLQFTYGGATLAYGAGGVALALHETGRVVPSEFIDWLARYGTAERISRPGLYDGMTGVAYVLWRLGQRTEAIRILNGNDNINNNNSVDLFGGASGIGLTYSIIGKALSDNNYLNKSIDIGRMITMQIKDKSIYEKIYDKTGLFRGASGIALFLITLFEHTGEKEFLKCSAELIEFEISRGKKLEDGTFHLQNGHRYLVYLDGGSVGLAFSIRKYLKFATNEFFSEILCGIERACQIPFVIQPGLFQGRAGLIGLLASAGAPSCYISAEAQSRRLGWHAIAHNGQIHFPGSGLVRLSCDLATGTAGVLLSLLTLRDKEMRLPGIGRPQ